MTTENKTGFVIQIYYPNGDANGLRVVRKDNWTGVCLFLPRSIVWENRKKRSEFEKPGVYILIGISDLGLPEIYIGEGDPVIDRIEDHYRNKDFWTHLVFFTSTDDTLTKTQIQYLEAALIRLATEAKRSKLGQNKMNLPSISEAEECIVKTFLDNMLMVYPVFGVDVFDITKNPSTVNEIDKKLELKGKNVVASGYETTEGFLILKGSEAVLQTEVTDSIKHAAQSLRQFLIDENVLQSNDSKFVFTADYVFDSPSQAASIVLGNSVNGRTAWKNRNGKSLKDIQNEKAI